MNHRKPDNDVPIRSPRYDTPRGGKLLDDATILRYILAGHYGNARRIAALVNLPPKPKKRTKAPAVTVDMALALLKSKTK